VVYSSLILSTFRIVAVKEVRFADRSARHQVARELNALSKTQSPYIVKMLGAHLDASSECVTMVLEYVNGGSLQDFINIAKGEHLLEEPMLVNIAHDVCMALAYCHGVGMAHLDVKPSNILLSLDGTAKLADFGLARQIELNKMAATFVGTTKYLSPERIKGLEYSFPADVWGLGMCLLAAALGKYPFEEVVMQGKKNEQGVYWSLLERLQTPPMPTLPTDSFSYAARRFCNSCLALDPKQRPKASELAVDAWFAIREDPPPLPLAGSGKAGLRKNDAAIMVLGEVCDAIVRELMRSGSQVVNIDAQLVTNLGAQLGLSDSEVRLALEATANRQMASTPLSNTLKSSVFAGGGLGGNKEHEESSHRSVGSSGMIVTPPFSPEGGGAGGSVRSMSPLMESAAGGGDYA
jgi:serine/threonine protein kinase